jgi:hypothetical protein
MDTNPPLKNPYRMANTRRPPSEWAPRKANARHPEITVIGTMTTKDSASAKFPLRMNGLSSTIKWTPQV